jgi:hypothetical protein
MRYVASWMILRQSRSPRPKRYSLPSLLNSKLAAVPAECKVGTPGEILLKRHVHTYQGCREVQRRLGSERTPA